jgi:hypothetical protein
VPFEFDGRDQFSIGTYFPRYATRLFERAGYTNFTREQFVITRYGPAEEALSKFVELYLTNLLERTANFLSDKMCLRLEHLANPESPEFLPQRPDFAFSSIQALMMGRAVQ